ncbi:MAG: alpha/beta fold hydrolase [Pseudonocardia sp.]
MLNHHREGSGPPLVLIHGVGHHWQAWRPVIERLTGEFEVFACDSPGFGGSPPLARGVEPTVWAYVEAFEKFFSDHGLERPHVAGNSMGGAIALELARRGSVASATALSPAGFWTRGELHYAQTFLRTIGAIPTPVRPAVLAAARTRAGRTALFPLIVGRPGDLPGDEAVATLTDLWAAPAFAGALRAFDHYEFTAGHELDGVRVTVAWGDKDRLLPYRRQAPRARAALPHARHVTLDAGHVPYTDAPDAVADVVRTTATGS